MLKGLGWDGYKGSQLFLHGVIGKVGGLANDGAGNLLALDGASRKLFRINPKNLAISVIARDLPVVYELLGSYPAVEYSLSMAIGPKGDIYISTADRGLIMLQKIK